nr:NAD-dependent protein deacylase [Lachnospiraceae bacterium]
MDNNISKALEEKVKKLQTLIDSSKRIVFFGGAGVSTESGIPDFRSEDGLYRQKYKYPPETILSHTFFVRNTADFYEFYRDKMICDTAEPNITHKFLAELEEKGKLLGVVTQNIDGLHQAAGTKNIAELHGSIHRNYCTKCRKFHPLSAVKSSKGIPLCECGGIIKPDVVLYEEGLDGET